MSHEFQREWVEVGAEETKQAGAEPNLCDEGGAAVSALSRSSRWLNRPVLLAMVDDEESIRRSIQILIGLLAPLWKVAVFEDAPAALRALPEMHPHLVLMDVRMPGLSGIDCLVRLRERMPGLPVVMFSACMEPHLMLEALSKGAAGYLLKPLSAERLVHSLQEALSGRVVLCQEAQVALLRQVRSQEVSRLAQNLSRREHQILFSLVQDLSDKEIAQRLGIAPGTVHRHLARLFRKLGVHSRQEARAKLGRD